MTENPVTDEKQEDNWLVKMRIAAGYTTQQESREALRSKGMEKHTATISLWERDEGGIPISNKADSKHYCSAPLRSHPAPILRNKG